MKLIEASYEILKSQGYLKDIELAARTCYKSEDKITEGTDEKMVQFLINKKHGAMLEHGTIYLKIDITDAMGEIAEPTGTAITYKYQMNKYSKVVSSDKYTYITTNYRVLIENNWLDDLKYQVESTPFHEKRISVRFICDRGVSHELVRHRVFSFAQESTRYCNYSKDKFGNELTFIVPIWLSYLELGSYNSLKILNDYYAISLDKLFYATELQKLTSLFSLAAAEVSYFKLLEMQWTPQQARMVLPNSLKTELIMTGFESDWKEFFKLRDSLLAHPQMRELAHPLHIEMGI